MLSISWRGPEKMGDKTTAGYQTALVTKKLGSDRKLTVTLFVSHDATLQVDNHKLDHELSDDDSESRHGKMGRRRQSQGNVPQLKVMFKTYTRSGSVYVINACIKPQGLKASTRSCLSNYWASCMPWLTCSRRETASLVIEPTR